MKIAIDKHGHNGNQVKLVIGECEIVLPFMLGFELDQLAKSFREAAHKLDDREVISHDSAVEALQFLHANVPGMNNDDFHSAAEHFERMD